MKNLNLLALLLALAGLAVLPLWAALTGETVYAHDIPADKIIRIAAPLGTDGVQRAEIVGGEYYYKPNDIVVKVNTPVELKFKKAAGGYIPHDVIVKAPEAGINFKIDLKNDFQTVTFTPTKIGKYPMYCDKSLLWFATHQEKGMEGLIEVVE